MNRRDFIKIAGTAGLVMIPVCNVALASDAPMVAGDDPMAKALGYLAISTLAGSNCANCAQSKGDVGATTLACNLFPGKQVSAAGVCKAWSKRA